MNLPISAIVVGLNEAELLKNSLPSISFCDEILYFDLGSSDNSVEVANRYGCTVIMHEKVLSCEWIHSEYAQKTKYEWVLIIDPDEVLDTGLQTEMPEIFNTVSASNTIGAVSAPWLFYFKKSRLQGTPWGGINYRVLLVNNTRFQFSPYIHVGRKLLANYSDYKIVYNGSNGIQHYWMRSYSQLIEKHKRYLTNEATARNKAGHGSSRKIVINEPWRSFRYSFFSKKGYLDGAKGFLLSLFWAWYQASAQYRLYKYQQQLKQDNNVSS